MSTWDKLKPFLEDAHKLLLEAYEDYIGHDPRGYFDISDPQKAMLIPASDVLGSFDAWTDCVSLNIEHDPLGTAVHELLHANSFSDDWLPEDTGTDQILSLRGFEVQKISANRTRVIAILYRGINEGVTELLTIRAFQAAVPAYVDLLPFAQELSESVGFDALVEQYFREGYPGLEDVTHSKSFDLEGFEDRIEGAYEQWRRSRHMT